MNKPFLRRALHFWFLDFILAGINFGILSLVYEPMWGSLVAHQIDMITRMVYICILAYFLIRPIQEYRRVDLLHAGLLWLGLTLLWEWGGSLLIGRPVEDILVGWNIFAGYLWPFVLLTYFFANLAVGTLIKHPIPEN